MHNENKDSLYAEPVAEPAEFAFDARVAEVFPDMIQRSVPGYASILSMLGVLAERYVQPDSQVYDLGCSLGAATLAMRRRLEKTACRMLAVDNSAAMLARAQRYVAADASYAPVELLCADIRQQPIERASMVVMNFTLQFLAPADRLQLLQRIYQGLLPGGILVVSEKIKFDAPEQQDFFTEHHHDFKRANGYSELEISQKRSALEHVLIPDSVDSHLQRLQAAGFARPYCWFQAWNFVSLLAVK